MGSYKSLIRLGLFAQLCIAILIPAHVLRAATAARHNNQASITLVCSQQRLFGSGRNLHSDYDARIQWLVAGVQGGDGQVGTISVYGLYTAPHTVPEAPVEVTAVDRETGKTVFQTAVTIVENPAVSEAHERWLEGAKQAAAEHGCDANLVVQSPTETVDDAIKLYLQVAGEHTCLVLQPVSENPNSQRYSFASGGEKDGVNILYISDASRIRIWNGEEVAVN